MMIQYYNEREKSAKADEKISKTAKPSGSEAPWPQGPLATRPLGHKAPWKRGALAIDVWEGTSGTSDDVPGVGLKLVSITRKIFEKYRKME